VLIKHTHWDILTEYHKQKEECVTAAILIEELTSMKNLFSPAILPRAYVHCSAIKIKALNLYAIFSIFV